MSFQLPSEKSQVQTLVAPRFLIFLKFLNSNKKMIEILTKIGAKITIIVVENREPYYFIVIYKCKEVPLSLFCYQMLASTFDSNERSNYCKIYGYAWIPGNVHTCSVAFSTFNCVKTVLRELVYVNRLLHTICKQQWNNDETTKLVRNTNSM